MGAAGPAARARREGRGGAIDGRHRRQLDRRSRCHRKRRLGRRRADGWRERHRRRDQRGGVTAPAASPAPEAHGGGTVRVALRDEAAPPATAKRWGGRDDVLHRRQRDRAASQGAAVRPVAARCSMSCPNGTGGGSTARLPVQSGGPKIVVRARRRDHDERDLMVELADGVYAHGASGLHHCRPARNGHTDFLASCAGKLTRISGGRRSPVGVSAIPPRISGSRRHPAPLLRATLRRRRNRYPRALLVDQPVDMSFNNTVGRYRTQPELLEQAHESGTGRAERHRIVDESVLPDSKRQKQRGDDGAARLGREHLGLRHRSEPLSAGTHLRRNDYTLLDQPGEWYQDTTAGVLYYIPIAGQDLTKVDVELPQLQYLLAVGAACPSSPTNGCVCSAGGWQSDAGRRVRRAGRRRPVRAAGTRSGLQRPDVLAHELARAQHGRIRRPADRRISRRSAVELPGRRPDGRVRGVRGRTGANAGRGPGVGGEEHLVRARPVRRPWRGGAGDRQRPQRARDRRRARCERRQRDRLRVLPARRRWNRGRRHPGLGAPPVRRQGVHVGRSGLESHQPEHHDQGQPGP